MIRSMTGIGVGKGYGINVELKSFNHKHLEMAIKMPERLKIYEAEIKEWIRNKIKRGYLQVSINLEGNELTTEEFTYDENLVENILKICNSLKEKYNLKGEVDINFLLSLPGVLKVEKKEKDNKTLYENLKKIFNKALTNLIKMREKEGRFIAQEFRKRLSNIIKLVKLIEERIPSKLKEKENALLNRVNFNNKEEIRNRILQEISLLQERIDISEECSRLRSHAQLFLSTLKEKNSSGRKLEFILSEMIREIETLASKARDFYISEKVILIKEEIDKLREQVRNVE
ncbi:MAG: YicC family protein [candidate division WOR-3 bacterium]|nr:YicC family protein [candidate division WOR-3 bacterium]MCX7836791.1 YicC family protein [candidate division WOR-3 bacterium]MDW8113571.1 YicC/YloC family endoribonuclease [candidate division WOR-3 bacterium]